MASPADQPPSGHWVDIEDQYDWDSFKLGPFPTVEAAFEYCDANNGAQLEPPAAALGDQFAPKDVGVWSLASCAGYDVCERLRGMLRDPATIPREGSDALKRRHGARTTVGWRLEAIAAASVDRCWCAELKARVEPAATADQLEGYVRRDARHEREVGRTRPSDGSLELCRCVWCGGVVAHLMIEVEAIERIVHHYYTPTSEAELAALDTATYESWAARRPGIYSQSLNARAYRSAAIGTAQVQGWSPAGADVGPQGPVQGWLFEAELGDSRFFVADDGFLLVGRDPSCAVWVINDEVAPIAMLVDGINGKVSVAEDKPTPLVVNGVRVTEAELQAGMRLRIAIDAEYRAAPCSGFRLRTRPPRADEVRRFASELGRQLTSLHARGLVHGAITPDQVLVDDAGTPWLLVHRPARAGTVAADSDPQHLAPEVRAGGPLTAAADVYALGTLFVPALRDQASDLGLVTFVGQLMNDDPDRRPAAWRLI